MTEAKFTYDERLLERCVKSSLYQQVIAHRDASLSETDTVEETSSNNDARSLVADMGNLASPDPRREEQTMRENQMEDSDDPQACVTLFHEHRLHYYGQQPAQPALSVASYLYKSREAAESASSPSALTSVRRFEAFVENVGFVHRHNSRASDSRQHPQHRVALNRFSDRRPNEILSGAGDGGHVAGGATSARRHLLRQSEQADPPDEEDDPVFDRRILAQLEKDGVVVHLDDAEAVMSVSIEGIGKGSMNHLNPKKYEKIYHQSKTLTLNPDEPLRQFQTPEVLQELDGAILSIRPEQPMEDDTDDDDDKDADGPPPSQNPVFVSDQPPEEEEDEFARNLNWATAENPDGVAIVHEPIDQVRTEWHTVLLRGGSELTLTLVLVCFVLFCFVLFCFVRAGHVRGLLGVRRHRVAGGVGVPSGGLQRLSNVREAPPVRDRELARERRRFRRR
jgi:hypothetical protein